jgi:hypothetical protein
METEVLIIKERRLGAMSKNEKTSSKVGSLASKQLSSPKSTPAQKSVAASALTQRPNHPTKKGR